MASFQPDADLLDEEVDVYNRVPDHGYEDFSTEEGPCAEQPTPDPMRSTHAQASWLAGDPPQGLQSEGDFASCETVVALSQALCRLIQIYFRSFNSDFQVGEALSSPPQAEAKPNPDSLRFIVHAAYWLPLQWTDSGITYLPLVLGSVPDWSRDTLPYIYRVLESWTFKSPLETLALLTPKYIL
ncbi:UNVERIFIED_CONTAM: hypothetical protein FKN15_012318 [Acipenser sinensis]